MSLLGDKSSSSMTLDAAEKVDVNTAVKAYTDKLKQVCMCRWKSVPRLNLSNICSEP